MNFLESKTKENIARAFAAECQDGARYQFMAKSAVSEGFSFISDQLKMIAKNEMAHASRLYQLMIKYLGEAKEDNIPIEAGYPFEPSVLKTSLQSASEIELYEAKNIYPAFAKIAEDENFPEIAEAFTLIAEAEVGHNQILQAFANMYKNNCLYKHNDKILWKCSNCGHEHTDKQAWENCPLCSYPQGYVIIPPQKIQQC